MGGAVFFYLGSLLLLSLFCFFLGFLFFKFLFPRVPFPSLFTRSFTFLFAGTCVLLLAYSLVKSGGRSLNIFLVPLFCVALYDLKGRQNPMKAESTRSYPATDYVKLLLLVLLPFLYFLFVVWRPYDMQWLGVNYDKVLYAKLSQALAQSGIENKWHMYLSDPTLVQGWEPYHYLDSWLNACVYSFLGTNPVIGFHLVVYPYLGALTLLGILAIIEHYRKIRWIDLFVAALLLFTGPILFFKGAYYGANRMAAEIPLQIYGEKFMVYYPFLLAAVLLFMKGFPRAAFVCSLSLMVVSQTLVPALAILLLVVVAVERKRGLYDVALMLVFLSLLALFYAAFVNKNTLWMAGNGFWSGFLDMPVKVALTTYLQACVINARDFATSYFWVFPIMVCAQKFSPLPKPVLWYALAFVAAGLICSALFFAEPDGHQFFSNTQMILNVVVILCLIGLIYSPHVRPRLRVAVMLPVVVLLLFNATFALGEYRSEQRSLALSPTYVEKVKTLAQDVTANRQVGLLCSQNDYVRYVIGREHNMLYHLAYAGLDPLPVNLSSLEITELPDTLMAAKTYPIIRGGDAFYRFATSFSESRDPDSLRLAYIQQNKLAYLLLAPGYSCSPALSKLIADSCVDTPSGWRFARLYRP